MTKKDEIEAVGQRIAALEENQLKVAKELGRQGVAFFLTLAGIKVATLGAEKYKPYEKYMEEKLAEANKQIGDAQGVDEVIGLSRKFTDDCIDFTGSQFK